MAEVGPHILVTGATGFIGGFLCRLLLAKGFAVRGTILDGEAPEALAEGVLPVTIGPMGPKTFWKEALEGIDIVVHLAARVHIMADPVADPLQEFRKVNVAGTLKLARDAAEAGVRRFVFVSSIKVNGEESSRPYTADSLPNPTDPYGISKWEAEQGLRRIEAERGLEVVVTRPTMVYGPGVKANFLSMMKVINRGIPLPLASVNNRRSLIYVGNLADVLHVCAVHPLAAGGTFLVSDGEDVSTPELLRRTGSLLGQPARLFPVPVALLRLAAVLTGKRAAVQRLTGSLTVDCSKTARQLGWRPPYSMEDGLGVTAAWFKDRVYPEKGTR